MFTESDKRSFMERGISMEKINWQLNVFQKGVPYIKLIRAAKVDDGIIHLGTIEMDELVERFEKDTKTNKLKFVPASGAASRMFKSLFEYIDNARRGGKDMDVFIETFFRNIEKFAFVKDLKVGLDRSGEGFASLIEHKAYADVLKFLLDDAGLGYGKLPKGLLKFHRYSNQARTPFEEHLYEASQYGARYASSVSLHFTVSPEHLKGFTDLQEIVLPEFEKRFGMKFTIGFSAQKPSTDTMAVDLKNEPFRDKNDSILFRPAGHGALIDNLNDLEAEIIFIKNIDNVVPEKHCSATVLYKKALAGKLLELRDQVFALLNELDSAEMTSLRAREIHSAIVTSFCYESTADLDFENLEATKEILRDILNRPIRVCGMVKNQGEPGGGPFWAENSLGDITLQVIESSQLNHTDTEQKGIFSSATHFNPVDLVCSIYNYKGEKFDLTKFVDPSTCFISNKSKDGRELKALELPGLWNGAMADWLTLFVEVPVETFNPVKTVNDLLRPMHQ